MARPSFSAGEVGVDVVPVTDRFFAELRAKLHELRDLKVPVDFDPDDMAARRTYERWNGRKAKVDVDYDVDMSGLKKLSQQDERMRKQYRTPIKPVFDDSSLVDGMNRAIDRSKRLESVSRKVGDVFTRNVGAFGKTENTRLREQMLLLDQSEAKLAKARADRNELASMRGDEWSELNQRILGNMSTLEGLQKQYDSLGDEIQKVTAKRDALRSEGRRDDAKEQTARLRELRSEYRACGKNIREVTKETDRLSKQQDKLKSDSIAKWIDSLDKQIRDLNANTGRVRESFNSLAKSDWLKDMKSKGSSDNILSGTSFLGKDWNRRLTAARKEQERLNESWRKGDELSGNLLQGTARYSRNLKSAANVMNTYRNGVKDANRLLSEQESQLKALQDALHGVNRYGRYSEINKQLNDQLAATRKLRKQMESNPIKAKLVLDDSQFNRKYANVTRQVRELTDKLERENDLNIRVRFWEDTADSLEERLNKLRHERINIPVDIRVDNENLISRAREMAEKVKANPDRKVELEADLDLDMKHAEERIKDFQKKNDEFDMDVDLETAAARAHLAYFTRPRTIDIFAKFKGTDMGKIMQGMTTGATGIRGVQNEWQKLVNMFDSFDKVVPKWSLLGAVFTSVGAGALNLSRTVGSVGASLVTMSKAALAAPGALLGVAAGYEVAYAAANKLGAYVDVSTTKLAGLHDKLADSFWKQAANPVIDMMNALGSSKYVENMNGLAAAEGRIVASGAKIVAQGDYVSRVNSILGNTVKGVNALNPGVRAVTSSVIRLGDMTSSYLPRMANYVSRNATLMAQWVDEAERTGKVTQSMEKAIEQGGYLMSSVKSLGGILKGTFGTLAEGENGIEKFSEQLQRADKAVNGVRFQSTLTAWADGAKDASSLFHDSFREIGDAAYELRDTTKQVFVDAGSMVSTGIGSISSVLGKSKSGIADFSNGVSEGFQKLFRSLDSAAPMFDSLLSMVGELSDTFGGTLANSLKAAAPTIKVLAEGASEVAEAFGKLPAPIQAVIGMYATFGKAGISAYNSLKRGMLENIQSTLAYRKTMNQLGITSKETSISMRELVQAITRLNAGQTAGVLTGEASSIRQVGVAADETTAKLNRMNRVQSGGNAGAGVVQAGSESVVNRIGSAAESSSRKVGLLKSAWNGVVDFLGGPVGIAIGGVTAALGLAGSAISSYNDSAAHTQSVNQSVASSFKDVSGNVKSASAAVEKAKKSIAGNWTDKDYGWNLSGGTSAEKLFSGIEKSVSPFKDSSKAADALGLSLGKLKSAATGTNGEYNKMHDQLTKLANDNKLVTGFAGQTVDANQRQTEAASRLLGVLENSRREWQKGAKAVTDWVNGTDSVTATSAAASDKLNLLSESLAANNFDLNENTKNGKANKSMMTDYANSALLAAKNIIAAGNGSAEANQKAKNSIYSARQEIVQMAEQCGMTEEQANQLADQLGLIPDKVSTQFDVNNLPQTKAQVQEYLDMLPLAEGQKTMILNLVDDKAITSFEMLKTVIAALMGGADEKDLKILLDAQDDASGKIKDVDGLAKSLGLSKADIKILAKDEAGPKLDEVKKKLHDKGLTDAQIQILIDALDKASDKMDKANAKKKTTEKGVSFTIDATDNASPKVELASQTASGFDGRVFSATLEGNPAPFDSTVGVVNATQLIPHSSTLSGNPNPFNSTVGVVNATQLLAHSSLLKGNPNPFNLIVGVVNAVQLKAHKANLGANPNPFWSIVRGIPDTVRSSVINVGARKSYESQLPGEGSVIRTVYMDVVKKESTVKAATGGRVYGAGTGTSDSIPAWLSNGEAVLKASSLRKLDAKYGPAFFDTLNATGDVPSGSRIAQPSSTALAYRRQSLAYANGGRVRSLPDNMFEVTVNVPNTGTTVNQTFNTKVVRSNDDLYAAAPILHRNALAEARRYQR